MASRSQNLLASADGLVSPPLGTGGQSAFGQLCRFEKPCTLRATAWAPFLCRAVGTGAWEAKDSSRITLTYDL